MSKLSKIFFSVILIALFVFSSFAVNAQGSSNSFNYLSVNAANDPMTIIANISLTKAPYCIATNDETNRVYVGVNDGLMVLNGDTNQVIADIPLGDDVVALAVNPTTNRIYAGIYGKNVTVFDGATNLKVGEIAERLYNSYELTINPTTNRVYVADWSTIVGVADSIRVYNGQTLQLINTVNLGLSTNIERVGVTVNPNTNKVYAVWTGNNSLFMIDGTSNLITKNVLPSFFSRNPMVNTYTGYVHVGTSVLNGETLEQVTPSLSGEIIAVDSAQNHLYIISSNTNLSRLDGSTRSLISSLRLNSMFFTSSDRAAINSRTSKLYVIRSGVNEVTVIPEFPLLTPALLAFFALAIAICMFKNRMFRTNSTQHTKTA